MTKEHLNIQRVEEIRCYRFIGPDGTSERLDFIPVDNAPGFSHRVAYNGKLTRKYLGVDFTLCQRNALDMLDIIRSMEAATPNVAIATNHEAWCMVNHPECGPIHCSCGHRA